MLKIFKLKINKINTKLGIKGEPKGIIRHYPAANNEWINSIYTFNKNTIKLIPIASEVVTNLVRSYFNMYSSLREKKMRAPRIRTWKRRLSSRNIWISKAELKHTSDKVIITLYIFNRQNTYYIRKLINILSYTKILILFRAIKPITTKYLEELRSKYNKFFEAFLGEKVKLFKNHEKSYINSMIIKALKKEMLIMYYLQAISFNNLKFTSAYIVPLKVILESLYGKKIIFNLISLKNYYLNSDILTQILVSKTRNRKNRVVKVLKASLINIKTPTFNPKLIVRESTKYIGVQNLLIKDSINYNNKDILNEVINNNYLNNTINVKENNNINILKTKEENILNSIKNKTVCGIRLEASGRLTKRITAARSIFKLKYAGTLRNIDASYKGLSTVILRGNTKSNIQHTKLKSKTRIGSFGLKGWVSSI